MLNLLKFYKNIPYQIHKFIGEYMKFRPLHDRVLIKVLDSEEKTAGGIIIPDTAKEKPQRRRSRSNWSSKK